MRVLLLMIVTQFVNCGTTADEDGLEAEAFNSTSGTLNIEFIADVKEITEPVAELEGNESSAIVTEVTSFNTLSVDTSGLWLANTGVSLGRSTAEIDADFDSTSDPSKAFCDSVNTGMKFIKEVSEPDLSLCLLKSISDDSIKMLDNEFQVWDMNISEEGELITERQRFRIKQVDDEVTEFEAFICESVDGSEFTQLRYMRQTIANNEIEVLGKSAGEDGFKLKVLMTAKLDSAGKIKGLKTIDYAETTENGQREVQGIVVQSDQNIEYTGYESSFGRLTEYHSFIELIDSNTDLDNYAVTQLAYGDGAALVRVTQGGSASVYTEGWNGDTLNKDSSSSRLVKVEDTTDDLIDSSSFPDLSFTADETWDCQDSPVLSYNVPEDDFIACMTRYDIDQEGRDLCADLNY